MARVGFEPTISAGERRKTYALDRAANRTDSGNIRVNNKEKECGDMKSIHLEQRGVLNMENI